MAENDIYNSEGKYNSIKDNIDQYAVEPSKRIIRSRNTRNAKYWIKDKGNIKYFKQLFTKFEARDTSFIRRIRLFRTFLIVNHVLDKDLAEVTREEIDTLMAFAHSVNKSSKSKRDFALDTKFLWRQLFPELDQKGRVDDTITPYPVRHLTGKQDKSKEKLRGDKFSIEEFERLIQSFSDDPRMQCLLTVSLESLGRPQELLGRKIKDVELSENYAKIYITEHGKEGVGFLRIIDSYFYLTQWLSKHPNRKDGNAWLFCNTGRVNRYKQMTPFGANKLIRGRCSKLGIDKPITMYSLKRNGVTIMRLQGKSDVEIQHTARWTSTKQLKTYDMSNQEESFKLELVRRGKIKAEGKFKEYAPTSKKCAFCGQDNGIAEGFCSVCNRPLDKEVLERELAEKEIKEKELSDLKEQMAQMVAKVNNLIDVDKAILLKKAK